MFQNLKEKLFPTEELIATIKRFPLSIACSTILFVFSLLLLHDVIDDEEWMGRIFVSLGCFYFWFGISRLIGESQKLSLGLEALITLAGAGFILGLVYIPEAWPIHLLYFSPTLFLMIMVAPYLKGGDDVSVWFFNRTMWFGVFVSYAALLLFAGGLTVALLAIKLLFDVDIPDKLYGDIWLFASLILGPVYALSWVPERFEFTQEECNDPPGLKFIANWISVPMIFLYLLILYAYFIKIMIEGELPSGHLAYMISGFVGAGIFTYLIAFPLREEGSAQLKFFYKIFFPALIIPVGFHAFAVWERVNAYGLTEQRYMLMVSVIWFAFLALANLKKRLPIRYIPISLAVLMTLSSFGPWGGVSLSTSSQYHRLTNLLEKNNLLADGKPVKAKTEITFEDRKSISSILNYLCRAEKDYVLEPLFNMENKEGWYCSARTITEDYLGFKYIHVYGSPFRSGGAYESKERFNLNAEWTNYMVVGGYDIIVNGVSFYAHRSNDNPPKSRQKNFNLPNNLQLRVVYEPSTKEVSLKTGDYDEVLVDMNAYVATKDVQTTEKQDLGLVVENDDVRYKLEFRSISGEMEDETPFITNFNFDLLIDIK